MIMQLCHGWPENLLPTLPQSKAMFFNCCALKMLVAQKDPMPDEAVVIELWNLHTQGRILSDEGCVNSMVLFGFLSLCLVVVSWAENVGF